jgi:hypothetical protein
MTPTEIQKTIYKSVGKGNCWQMLQHLLAKLRKVDEKTITDALIPVFLTAESSYQAAAGGLLWKLKPAYQRNLYDDIKASLTSWDVSVEELPWYLAESVGIEMVKETIELLKLEPLSEEKKTRLETYEYWLNFEPVKFMESLDRNWNHYLGHELYLSGVKFTQLNDGWNADPNVPNEKISFKDSTLVLTFKLNSYLYDDINEGDIGKLTFQNCTQYRNGPTNDEGFYRKQCRFSEICPQWGEFYLLDGNKELMNQPEDWIKVDGSGNKHYLFYLRDGTFECIADNFLFENLGQGYKSEYTIDNDFIVDALEQWYLNNEGALYDRDYEPRFTRNSASSAVLRLVGTVFEINISANNNQSVLCIDKIKLRSGKNEILKEVPCFSISKFENEMTGLLESL